MEATILVQVVLLLDSLQVHVEAHHLGLVMDQDEDLMPLVE